MSRAQCYHKLSSWKPFYSLDCQIIRPALQACLNQLKDALQIFYISNNPKRWTSELGLKCKACFINQAPEGFYCSNSLLSYFKDIINTIFSFKISGLIIVSNEGKIILGKAYEISIELSPVILPFVKFCYYKPEFFLEYLIDIKTIRAEYVYGTNWIASSIAPEFANLCIMCKEQYRGIIFTTEYDLDNMQASKIPIFYVFFPSLGGLNTFLVRKIAYKECTRNINLAPIACEERNGEFVQFVTENFPCEEYSPGMLENGLHRRLSVQFASMGEKNKEEDEKASCGTVVSIPESMFRKRKNRKNKKDG